MTRCPDAREHRAEPLHMTPVGVARQGDGAVVDLEAHVPARAVGQSNAAPRDLVSCRRQQNGEATLARHSHHPDHRAPSPCRQARSTRRRACCDLTKYGQPGHNALPFDGRMDRSTIGGKPVHRAVVPHVARAQVVIPGGGITNAPRAISRLRV